MREIHDILFEKAVEGMTAEEVLNYYRNLYHAEPQSTEHGIVAKALNDILPIMILPPCKVGDTVWFELYGQIESAVIYHCTYELSHRGCLLSGAYAKDTRGLELSFNANSIGKAVFLTRKEAEQAMKGENHAKIH